MADPGVDGWSEAEAIRTNPRNTSTPVQVYPFSVPGMRTFVTPGNHPDNSKASPDFSVSAFQSFSIFPPMGEVSDFSFLEFQHFSFF